MSGSITPSGGASSTPSTPKGVAKTGSMGVHTVQVVRSPSFFSMVCAAFATPPPGSPSSASTERMSPVSLSPRTVSPRLSDASSVSITAASTASAASSVFESISEPLKMPAFATTHGIIEFKDMPISANSSKAYSACLNRIFEKEGDTLRHNLGDFDIVTNSSPHYPENPPLRLKPLETFSKQIFRDLEKGSLVINSELISKSSLKPEGFPESAQLTYHDAKDKLIAKIEEKLAGVDEPLKTRLVNSMQQGISGSAEGIAHLVFNTSYRPSTITAADKAMGISAVENEANPELVNKIAAGLPFEVGQKNWRRDPDAEMRIEVSQNKKNWKLSCSFPILVADPEKGTEERFLLKTNIDNVAEGSAYIEIIKMAP